MSNERFELNEKLWENIISLKVRFGLSDPDKIINYAVALLKIAADAQKQGLKLMVVDENDRPVKEIVLPD